MLPLTRRFLALLLFLTLAGCAAMPTAPRTAKGPSLAYIYRGDLYVRTSEGGTARLTRGAAARAPRWSPDGRWVNYFAGDRLWLAAANGSALHRLAAEEVVWAPREPLLAYTHQGKLWVVRVGPGGPEQPRELHRPARSPAWSPDGQRLAVVEEAPGQPTRLLVVPLQGGAPAELLRLPNEKGGVQSAYTPQNLGWSPDGRWIHFHQFSSLGASINADGVMLAVIPAGGGQVTQVGEMLGYPDWVQWRPDSKALAFLAGTGREAYRGKALTTAMPPNFRPTLKTAGVLGLDYAKPCVRKPGTIATAQVYEGSPSDPYNRPLPAIFVGQERYSRPAAPFGDHAPRWRCDGSLSWARISQEQHFAVTEGKAVAEIDLPSEYYGHYDAGTVLDWWEPH